MIENLPEAPASVNFVVDLRTKTVTSIQFTLRDSSEQALADRVRQLMKDLKVHVDEPKEAPKPISDLPPVASPPPVAQPVQQPPVARTGVPVTAEASSEVWDGPDVEVKISPSGIPTLNVRGGAWKKYGAVAWPENVPKTPAFEGWQEWPTKQTFSLPDPYTKAIVSMKTNDKGKLVPDRVLRFE